MLFTVRAVYLERIKRNMSRTTQNVLVGISMELYSWGKNQTWLPLSQMRKSLVLWVCAVLHRRLINSPHVLFIYLFWNERQLCRESHLQCLLSYLFVFKFSVIIMHLILWINIISVQMLQYRKLWFFFIFYFLYETNEPAEITIILKINLSLNTTLCLWYTCHRLNHLTQNSNHIICECV